MGRDRLLPQRLFGYVYPRLGTPVYRALLLGAAHLLGTAFLKFGGAEVLRPVGVQVVSFAAAFSESCVWIFPSRRRPISQASIRAARGMKMNRIEAAKQFPLSQRGRRRSDSGRVAVWGLSIRL